MKIFWLSTGQFITALILGTLIGLTITFASMPHLVAVPTQVITPVPTPPPVVITQAPQTTPYYNPLMISQVEMTQQLLQLIWAIVPITVLGVILTLVTTMVRGPGGPRI